MIRKKSEKWRAQKIYWLIQADFSRNIAFTSETPKISRFLFKNSVYRQHVLDIINRLSSSEYKYEDKALSKEKLILEAFAQKVFIK